MNQFQKDRNRLRGLRAKRVGETWENLLQSNAYRCGCKVIKIPSGCRWVSAVRAVAVKTPFDFVFIRGGKSVFLDAKTTLSGCFTFSAVDQDQIHWLTECAKGGAKAGYIVDFRTLKKVVFFSVEKLSGLRSRQSLKPEDGIQLSGDDDRLDLGKLFYERRSEDTEKDFGPSVGRPGCA